MTYQVYVITLQETKIWKKRNEGQRGRWDDNEREGMRGVERGGSKVQVHNYE